LFKYTNSYVLQKDIIDCLIVDEAHRLREKAPAGSFYSKIYSGKTQVEEIINACRVALFFIDDNQQVKPDEIGTSTYIKEHAEKLGCDVWEEQLQVQFRCAGNDGFVQWLDNTLDIQRTVNPLLEKREDFEVKIFDDPLILENELKNKIELGMTARIVSGFVFPWSQNLNPDVSLPLDVNIGDYHRPWNLKKKVDSNPASTLWAYDKNGFGQIGCIYSCQGFEFDYIGVIFGDDITYDINKGKWICNKQNNFDPSLRKKAVSDEQFLVLVKNIYRVLLSRGMKGCYIYFTNKETEQFIKTRMRNN